MAKVNMVLEVKVAWWFTYLYIPLLYATYRFCKLFNSEAWINEDAVNKVIDAAISVKVRRK